MSPLVEQMGETSPSQMGVSSLWVHPELARQETDRTLLNSRVILVLKNLIAVHAIRFFFALDIALRLSYGINDSAIIAAVSEHR